jgi:hypothetical protein
MKKNTKNIIISGVAIPVIVGIILFFILLPFNNKPIRIDKEEVILSPISLFEGFSLSTPIELIKEKLGAPHKLSSYTDFKDLIYHFDDFSLKIRTKDNETISTITILLLNFSKNIEIIPKENVPNLILGDFTFGNLLSGYQEAIRSFSSKDGWLWVDCYFGNPGFYYYYRVGIYESKYPEKLAQKLDFNYNSNEKVDLIQIKENKINFVSMAYDEADLDTFWFEDFM